ALTSERTQQPQRPRPRFRTAEVRRVERLSPRMVRITVGGEELDGFETPAPTQHLKLIIPEPGQDRPVLPDPSLPKGAVSPGQLRPLMRTYTVRRYDVATSELDIDFALHGDGPASSWAGQAKPGSVVALAGPGGRRYAPDLEAGHYLIAGDESAMPAIGILLEALPASVDAQVYVEVGDETEELDWRTDAQLHVRWLHRQGDQRPGDPLRSAIAQAPVPNGNARVWVACEASVMRQIRKHLLEDWRLDPSAIVTRGYWKEGEPNYRDGDYGED
ncbi:MAG: siderophore-interacting protein, partial [Chloroflexota bacterium]